MIELIRDRLNSYHFRLSLGKEFKERKRTFLDPAIEAILEGILKVLNPIVTFKKNLKNFFVWGWKMRDDRDWEDHYLMRVIFYKLDSMLKYYGRNDRMYWYTDPTHEHYVHFKALKICHKIAKRILDDNYDRYHERLTKLYGEIKMDFIPMGDGYSEMKITRKFENDSNRESIRAHERNLREISEKVRLRDRKIFFKLLEVHMEFWWD